MNIFRLLYTYIPKNLICITNALHNHVETTFMVVKTFGATIILLDALLEILSFATSHYAIGMQLIVVYNYLGHVCNYKFGIV
jgi:hypothetical protein